ncbi:hypothetical protein EVAR_102711_1 [Eumeta japonica]|uniref:Uncharacterized protein n=1 Tax=Eumeta variegata TaxID=151549 RepID=A0A4C1TIS7_EUMVA|nr:hypothetical protein EVAR_102711_1 [Eumeta japonica]
MRSQLNLTSRVDFIESQISHTFDDFKGTYDTDISGTRQQRTERTTRDSAACAEGGPAPGQGLLSPTSRFVLHDADIRQFYSRPDVAAARAAERRDNLRSHTCMRSTCHTCAIMIARCGRHISNSKSLVKGLDPAYVSNRETDILHRKAVEKHYKYQGRN